MDNLIVVSMYIEKLITILNDITGSKYSFREYQDNSIELTLNDKVITSKLTRENAVLVVEALLETHKILKENKEKNNRAKTTYVRNNRHK